MTRADVIKILLFTWRVIKAVAVLIVVYGFTALKYTAKAFIIALPAIVYLIGAFLGGIAGGAADAAASKASSRRPYHRIWSDEENSSYYHRR